MFAETGLLVGFFLPGDSLLITAGALRRARRPSTSGSWCPPLILAAIAGNATGYAIGKRTGKALYSRPDSLLFRREHLRMTHDLLREARRQDDRPGAVHPDPADVRARRGRRGEMGYAQFATYNVVGAICWVASMTLAGYALGNLVPDIEQRIHFVVAVVIALSLLPPGIAWLAAASRRSVEGGLQTALRSRSCGPSGLPRVRRHAHPPQIRLGPRIRRNHQEFGQFVGVQLRAGAPRARPGDPRVVLITTCSSASCCTAPFHR